MKNLVVYFFLILFVGLSFQQVSLFGMYLLNKEYITAQFCINKDKPELKCNGKCHLADALAQQSEREESSDLVLHVIIPVYYSNYILELPRANLRIYTFGVEEIVLLNSYEGEMFQPPQG